MDFRNLIAKLNQINESVEVVSEKAVSKSQQQAAGAALAAKRKGSTKGLTGASKEMAKMSTKELEKFAGTKHKGLPEKKKAEESFDKEAFRKNFESLVEAKAKPDFLDVDKDGDKKEPMKKAAKEAGKGDDKKETKGLSSKQKKLPAGLQKAIAKKKGTTESVANEGKGKYKSDAQRKAVHANKMKKESVSESTSFADLVKIVKETGGQQRIDPKDDILWKWASKISKNKFEDSRKAELYAGLVYERAGGRFEMYDVLAEDEKN